MNLDGVTAVFQLVGLLKRFVGKLARFAHDDASRPQRVGQSRREDEPARLDAHHVIDLFPRVAFLEMIHHFGELHGVAQQRRDVLELDSRFGKVGDVPDDLFQRFHTIHFGGFCSENGCRTGVPLKK